jgi:uncharacterized protein YqfA (UPF0365 family)
MNEGFTEAPRGDAAKVALWISAALAAGVAVNLARLISLAM